LNRNKYVNGKTVIIPFLKALKDLNELRQNRKARGY